MKPKIVDTLFVAAALLILSGCAAMDLSKGIPWSKKDDPPAKKNDPAAKQDDPAVKQQSPPTKKEEPPASTSDGDAEPLASPVPARISAVWTDTVLQQNQKPPVRGFGGRIMFYAEDGSEPLVVDGRLTVYAFADEVSDVASAKPERRYVFLREQFAEHYSRSELGHSYSVWLPWDKVGGPQRKVSLIARFEPSRGGSFLSDASRQVLPGMPRDSNAVSKTPAPAAAAQSAVRQISARESATPGVVQAGGLASPSENRADVIQQVRHSDDIKIERPAEPKRAKKSMTTVTIDVPSGFVKRSLTTPLYLDVDQTQMQNQAINPDRDASDNSSESDRNGAGVSDSAEARSPAEEEPEERAARYSRPTRFVRDRFRVRNWQSEQRASDQIRRQPHRATWPSDLPQTPRSVRVD